MKRHFLILLVLQILVLPGKAQKSKVLSVFHLIEAEKYEDAKKAIEEAITEENTARWPKTWYARGFLCQVAYEKGIAGNDKKKYELYPDQLYVAYESYQNALVLDHSGRLNSQLEPLFVNLANDFQKLGERHFQSARFSEALRAFETSVNIIEGPVLIMKADTSLVYNTALSAYESKEWPKAILYLRQLNKVSYSPEVSKLLFDVFLETGDTISAEDALSDGIDRYEENKELVLLLADFLVKRNDFDKAIQVLDHAVTESPSDYIFPYTRGLVYQKRGHYPEAILSYENAAKLAPGEVKIYSGLGTCYYNMGVEIEENALSIKTKKNLLEEKEKSRKAFQSAVEYFRKVLEMDPEDQYSVTKLYQLYKVLGMTENIRSLEHRIR